MGIVLTLTIMVVCFIAGWISCLFRMSKDESIASLRSDEIIVKRPENGYILVAVTPEIARNLTMNSAKRDDASMRGIMQGNAKR